MRHLAPRSLVTAFAFTTLALGFSSAAHAQELHVGTAYDECYFDLHPELSQGELDTLAGEVGSILRFSQVASAETLGRMHFDIGLTYTSSQIDDSQGAWNDSFSHPDAGHELGDSLAFPRLQLRMGVTDHVDIGVYGTLNPNSNYGLIGIESKIAILRVAEDDPVDLSLRPHAGGLIGPEDISAANLSFDVAVSRAWFGLAPYVGVGTTMNGAFEHADDVDLEPGQAFGSVGFVGLEYRWTYISAAVQAEATTEGVPTYAARLSGTF